MRALRRTSLGDALGIGAILAVAIFSLVLLVAPSIIVVPRSVVFNWVDEARKFAPELAASRGFLRGKGFRFQRLARKCSNMKISRCQPTKSSLMLRARSVRPAARPAQGK